MKVNLQRNQDHHFLSISDYEKDENSEIMKYVKKEMKKCASLSKHICCPECGSYIIHSGFTPPYLRDSSIVIDDGRLVCNNCLAKRANEKIRTIKIDMNDPDFENYVPVEIVDLRILPPSGDMLSCNCS